MQARWLERGESIDEAVLSAEGIPNERIPVGAHDARLERLMRTAGYLERDEVALAPSTPGLDAICAKFADEHRHDEDEVRYVLEGEGIFDIRSRADRWMRVVVGPGDLLVIPGGRHHRFQLGESRTIRCVRLFRDRAGWVPHYRATDSPRAGH